MDYWQQRKEVWRQAEKRKKQTSRAEQLHAERDPFVAKRGNRTVRPTSARIHHLREEPYDLRRKHCAGCAECRMLDDQDGGKRVVTEAIVAGPDKFQKHARCPRRRYFVYAQLCGALATGYETGEQHWPARRPGTSDLDWSNKMHEAGEQVEETLPPNMKAWGHRLRGMLNAGNMGLSGKVGWSPEYRYLATWFTSVARAKGVQI